MFSSPAFPEDSSPLTVEKAEKIAHIARERTNKANISQESKKRIINKADELEDALDKMNPVAGPQNINGYEAVSAIAQRRYQELKNLLEQAGFSIEIQENE